MQRAIGKSAILMDNILKYFSFQKFEAIRKRKYEYVNKYVNI